MPATSYNNNPPKTVNDRTMVPIIIGDRSIGRATVAALLEVELAPVATAVTDPEPGAAVPVEVPLPLAS